MPNNASSLIARGSFTSTGAARTIEIQPLVDYFYLKNRTQWGAAANPGVVVQAEWFASLSAGAAYTVTNSAGLDTLNAGTIAAGGAGFTLIDYNNLPTYSRIALAAPYYTQANPAVFTTATAHGFAVGDIVQFSSMVTGGRQYAGSYFSVSAVGSSTTFSVLLNTTGITVATAGFVRKVAVDSSFYPGRRVITQATRASSLVLTLGLAHTFTVGQYVTFQVPSAFGMVELDGLVGKITAVDTTATVNSITLDIDSSGFTAFAWPATSALPFTFAEVIPVGEVATILDGATRNVAAQGLRLGTSVVGAASDIIDWWAFKADVIV